MLENGSLALWHNHNDINSFKQVLSLENLDELQEASSNDNIIRAYNFFKENMDISKIDRQAILNNIMFVGIDLAIEEDEQQIFDTINSLGVRLTTAELLKNYFFDRTALNDYQIFWMDIFEKNDEVREYWDKEVTTGRLSRTFIDLFFYSYLQIKVQDPSLQVKAGDKQEFSKVETLFESYKSLIKDYNLNKKELLIEIKEYALLFKANFNHNVIQNELTNEFGIERINTIIFGLETTTLIPYVLYVLKITPDESQRNELFKFIEAYVMRRMIVRATTKNYNQLFTDRLISNNIISKQQFIEYIEKSSDKVNYLPCNQELEDGFRNSKLINKQAAGIIYLIESRIRDRNKQATQLLGIRKYSLEHLMPKKWENKWPSLQDINEIETRNRKLLTLGNLAIITQSLNASIRDSNWSTKKEGNSKNQGLTHFSAGIETLAPYLELQTWDESSIESRATNLYKKALDVWSTE